VNTQQNGTIYVGYTWTARVTLTDADAAALVSTALSWKIALTSGTTALFTKTVGSGITVTATAGTYDIVLTAANTATLVAGTTYYHELVTTDSADILFTGELLAVDTLAV
jgi:hypothetical protein